SPLLGNVESPLAAEWAPRLVAPLLPSRQPDRPGSVQEAVTYLSNWDHRYDRASIGASIFDAWLEAFVQDQGAYPLPDSLFADSLRTVRSAALLERTLRASVAELSRQYGTDQSSWRWENVQPNDRLYPVWSDSTLLYGTSSLSETKYAPLDVPAPGHASTLARHPSLANRLPAPSSFTFWGRTDTWDELNVQPDVRSRQGFLTRSLLTVRAAPIAVDRRQPNAGARLSLRPS
ncbi:MAG: penicillin acylase family protein, partial [Bacteroidota bacterium]